GGPPRLREGYTYSLGSSVKIPTTSCGSVKIPTTTSGGRPLSEETGQPPRVGGFPVGNAVALGRNKTTKDLIDINGDGLPDRVRRQGALLIVRLNLGDRFGAEERYGTVQLSPHIDTFGDFEEAQRLSSTSDMLAHETTLSETVTLGVEG